MATRQPEATPAPQYGELRPRVIEFLGQVLIRGHKPEAAIRTWTKDGERRLGFRCARCRLHISVPTHGAMDIPGCHLPGCAKGPLL